jgi:hypothetical protein
MVSTGPRVFLPVRPIDEMLRFSVSGRQDWDKFCRGLEVRVLRLLREWAAFSRERPELEAFGTPEGSHYNWRILLIGIHFGV